MFRLPWPLVETADLIQLGFEDHWGSPGTGSGIDWNDLVVTVRISVTTGAIVIGSISFLRQYSRAKINDEDVRRN